MSQVMKFKYSYTLHDEEVYILFFERPRSRSRSRSQTSPVPGHHHPFGNNLSPAELDLWPQSVNCELLAQ